MSTTTGTITNPYPEWQALAAEMNCWNCYVILLHKERSWRGVGGGAGPNRKNVSRGL
jgi:hypothetical protein